jgi:hypothetical protein
MKNDKEKKIVGSKRHILHNQRNDPARNGMGQNALRQIACGQSKKTNEKSANHPK